MIPSVKEFLKQKLETLYFFYQYLGYKMFVLLIFSLLLVLMDSFGMAMFIPLLQVADSGAENITAESDKVAYQVKSVFDYLNLPITVYSMLFLIMALFTLKAVFGYYASKYSGINMHQFARGIRKRLGDGVQGLSYGEFIKSNIGRLQSSLTGEAWQVTSACSSYLDTIKNGLFVLVYLALAVVLDWKFSLLVVGGGLITNLIYRRFYVKTQELSREATKNNHRYGGIVIEVINHYKYLKATGRSNLFFKRMDNELDVLTANNIRAVELFSRLGSLREPMIIAIICTVIALYVYIFKMPLSGVIIVLLLFYRVMQKVVDLQVSWNAYLANTGVMENVKSFQAYLFENRERYEGRDTISRIDKIELRDVVLKYDDFEALKKVSLVVEKNQSVAFVGESGSGKTSLVNVICTLIPIHSGEMLINQKNVLDYDNFGYRSKIGYISQEPTIFNTDIFDNVTFWADKTPENMARFEQVLKMSCLYEFVNSLPGKESTLLGNNGLNLSGGQKQRVSIARELFRDVDLLVMDEATSALDSETEYMIKESIEALKGKVTIISIAHRLSTIKHSDMIYLLEKGEIVASGNFEELKKKSDYFLKLTELQGI